MREVYVSVDRVLRRISVQQALQIDAAKIDESFFCAHDDHSAPPYPLHFRGGKGVVRRHLAHAPNSECAFKDLRDSGRSEGQSGQRELTRLEPTLTAMQGFLQRRLRQVLCEPKESSATRLQTRGGADEGPRRFRPQAMDDLFGGSAVSLGDGRVLQSVVLTDAMTMERLEELMDRHLEAGHEVVWLWSVDHVVHRSRSTQRVGQLVGGNRVGIPEAMARCYAAYEKIYLFDRNGNIHKADWRDARRVGNGLVDAEFLWAQAVTKSADINSVRLRALPIDVAVGI